MSAQFLMISEIDVVPEESREVIAQWRSVAAADEVIERSFYQSEEGDKVMEISALKSLALNPSLLSFFSDTWGALGIYMKSDFRRQLLQFVEALGRLLLLDRAKPCRVIFCAPPLHCRKQASSRRCLV